MPDYGSFCNIPSAYFLVVYSWNLRLLQSRLTLKNSPVRGTLADAARVTQVSRRRRTQPPNPRHHPDGDTVAARTGSSVRGFDGFKGPRERGRAGPNLKRPDPGPWNGGARARTE